MSPSKIARTALVAALAVVVLGACAPRPYPVEPAQSLQRAFDAAPDHAPGARLIGICYGNALNSPEEVLAEARFQCGGDVELRDEDMIWTPCGLLQPVRATFLCTPAPTPEGQ